MKRSKYRYLYIVGVILLALTILFFVFSIDRHSYFEALDTQSTDVIWLMDQPIAHRGYYDNITRPENSIEAFMAAISKGYAIELDVRLTKDEHIVVVHDENLLRLTGADVNVSDLTLAEIKDLYLLNTGSQIPTLEETFSYVNGKVPILIEIKTSGLPRKLEQLTLELIEVYTGEVAVQSFDALSVKWFAKNASSVTRGLLLTGGSSSELLNHLKDNIYSMVCDPNFISYKYENLLRSDFKLQRTAGLIVLGWTVDENLLITREFTDYCDNIILEAGR
ncbi:MAG: glycerophosphodiester phosphodiesterase family protein [Clostridia bacterium]|jgi:glycerophosphoryl diester phosphodiesterase